MRKAAWYIILAMHICIIQGHACNICSGNSSIQGIGLNGIHSNNLVLLSCSDSKFRSDHLSGFNDRFTTLELLAKFDLGQDFKLSSSIPYRWASRSTSEKSNAMNGLGDLRLVLSKLAFDKIEVGNFATLSIDFGIGLSLPTSNQSSIAENPDLPVNFLGNSKSWALITEVSTVFNIGNSGLILEANYQLPFKNNRGEQSGNSISVDALIFHQFSLGKIVQLLPSLGLSFFKTGEFQLADGSYLFGSSGRSVNLPVGLNIKLNSFMLGVSHAIPLFQDYGGGEIDLVSKSFINCSYFF